MTEQSDLDGTDGIIATIENKDDPSQSIGLKYLSSENAFVTSGIQTHFGEKEILIPSHLVVINFELMATIVSSILEKLSKAREMETSFEYAPTFAVMDKKYSMAEYGEFVKLVQEDEEEEK